MSDFLVNFDTVVALSVSEWWKEIDRIEEEEKKEGNTEINEIETE